MRIVRATVTPVSLALVEPLSTAHGAIRERRGALLSLTGESGATAWGEALPLPGFGLESAAAAVRALEAVAEALVGTAHPDLDSALAAAAPATRAARSARAAADCALHDLAARDAGKDLAELLNPARRCHVTVSRLLAAEEPEAAANAARHAVASGFRTLKLKVGSDGPARDEARIAAVREAVGAGPRLRLDANAGWEMDTALDAVERFECFGIELIEQPLPAADFGGLARLRRLSPIPIAVDESLCDEHGAKLLLAEEAADAFVLKPAALGGLRAAWRIARTARCSGIESLVTAFLDSTLGITAALHLAAALPDSRFAAGLATAELLADDLTCPPAIEKGEMALPVGNGLGVSPDAAALERCTTAPVREFSA